MAVLGLLAQQPWKVESLQPQRLIPIDTTVLAAALPLGAAESGDDGLPLRGVAAYHAPQGDFSLSGRFVKPAAELAVTANVLLVVENGGLHAYGGWAMLPDVEKRFSFDFTLPAGWQLVSLAAADQQPLAFECYGPPAEARRVHVRLPQGIPPGQEYRAYFHALRTPPGWLADWKTQNVEFPAFPILGAAHDEGALVVAARDDLTVRPEKIQRLVPLDANEMGKYGLSGVTPSLAYRYETPPYAAALVVERTLPRLTARTCSCFRVSRDEGLVVRDEVVYHVEEARARRLALELPRDTPADLKIYGLGGTRLKEFLPEPGKPDDEMRRWNVFLEEPSGGEVRLGVEFKQPLPWKEGKEIKDCPLPVIRAADVAYQSGLVSVEGSAELDVQVDTAARRVDVGELAATEYQPGRYLRGVFGFVGAAGCEDRRQPAPGLSALLCHRPAGPVHHALVGRRRQPDAGAVHAAHQGPLPGSQAAGGGRAVVGATVGAPRRGAAEAAARGQEPVGGAAGRRGRGRLFLAVDLRGPGRDGLGPRPRHAAGARLAPAAPRRAAGQGGGPAAGRPGVDGPSARRLRGHLGRWHAGHRGRAQAAPRGLGRGRRDLLPGRRRESVLRHQRGP